MRVCTFFGHRDCPEDIRDTLKEEIVKLILENNVKKFYIGNNGNFDLVVKSVLNEISEIFTDIEYCIVIAYLSNEKHLKNTVYPEGIENCPKKFAIDWRNKWMVNQSDFVITYVKHAFGGAYKFEKYALKRGKQVINIFEKYN